MVIEGQRQRQKASQREIGRYSAAGPEDRGRGRDPRSTGKLEKLEKAKILLQSL